MAKRDAALAYLGAAKAAIDHGFSRLGPKLDLSDPAQRLLLLFAARSIAVSNAVAQLVRHDLSTEAAPLAVSLAGLAAEMSWIARTDSARRARELAGALKGRDADWFWDLPRLKGRMRELGFEPGLLRAVDEAALEHLEGNAGGIPWGHALPDTRPGLAPERLLELSARAASHALSALNAFWPASFEMPAYETEEND